MSHPASAARREELNETAVIGGLAVFRRIRRAPYHSGVSSGYDIFAGEYAALWEPVLAPSAIGLLDRCEPVVSRARETAAADRRPAVVVDVGTGAGILAVEAVRRWPEVVVHATDPSSGMLDAARARAAAVLDGTATDRLEFRTVAAHDLELPDASVDVVVSSFVYQLVPDRAAALREAYRVLRPGGTLAFVTWIVDSAPFPPADAFDDTLDAFDIPAPDGERGSVSGDYSSSRAAAAQLRRIGFTRVRVEESRIDHTWDAASYLETQERLWEVDLMASLEPERRSRLLADARERLERLPPGAFRWRAPVVYAFGVRPARGRRPLGWRRRR